MKPPDGDSRSAVPESSLNLARVVPRDLVLERLQLHPQIVQRREVPQGLADEIEPLLQHVEPAIPFRPRLDQATHEFFETLTLVQTKTLIQFPLVLFGKEYYQPLFDYMEEMARQGTISREDLSLVLLTDSIAEAGQHIDNFIKLNYRPVPRRRKWWLFEKYTKFKTI